MLDSSLATLPIPGDYNPISGNPRTNPLLQRPFIDNDNVRKVVVNVGYRDDGTPKYKKVPIRQLQERGINHPTWNATMLRREQWIQIDQQVLRAARLRATAVSDIESSPGGTYGGFNGMGKSVLEHETMSDPGEAMVDMNALTEGRSDSPKFQLEGVPLAITHVDFWYDLRTLTISRNGSQPLDTTSSEASGRRIMESLEKTVLGVDTGLTYGGDRTYVGGYGRTSSIYGYTNFSSRLTKTNLYKPTGVGRAGTAAGYVPKDTLLDVLAMMDQIRLNKFYGPFMLYHSNDWDQYMDADYILTGGNVATQTLRDRLRAIDGIKDVKRLDFLAASATTFANDPARITSANPFTLILVQQTGDVVRMVNGMDITTVQWEERGGLMLCFKVMCIKVPQLRADFYGSCGILHANGSSGV